MLYLDLWGSRCLTSLSDVPRRDAATSHAFVFAFVFSFAPFLKFCATLTFFMYGMDPFQLWRRMEGAIRIPTLVVVVDGGPTMRTLGDLSLFVAVANAVTIVCFARTQHPIAKGILLL